MKGAVICVRRCLLSATILLLAGLTAAVPASAAKRSHQPAHVRSHQARHAKPPPSPAPTGIGYDISYPQCNGAYPSGQAFGVVGVNDGLANNTNPCLSSELSWAGGSSGQSSQPKGSLYINTADPGTGVGDWPQSAPGSDPYGACDGSWSTACAWAYGQQRAANSYAMVPPNPSVNPASAPWWLDIETANSWATSGNSPNWAALNVATIRGFVDGLHGAGAAGPVGFYSTAYQWQAITGLTAETSPTYFGSDPDWVAGASSYTQAQSNCSASFTGAKVVLAQYPQSGFDGDYACP